MHPTTIYYSAISALALIVAAQPIERREAEAGNMVKLPIKGYPAKREAEAEAEAGINVKTPPIRYPGKRDANFGDIFPWLSSNPSPSSTGGPTALKKGHKREAEPEAEANLHDDIAYESHIGTTVQPTSLSGLKKPHRREAEADRHKGVTKREAEPEPERHKGVTRREAEAEPERHKGVTKREARVPVGASKPYKREAEAEPVNTVMKPISRNGLRIGAARKPTPIINSNPAASSATSTAPSGTAAPSAQPTKRWFNAEIVREE